LPTKRLKQLSERHAFLRLFISLVLGSLAGAWTVERWGLPFGLMVGWDVGSLHMLLMSWHIIATSDAAASKKRSAAEDPGRTLVWIVTSLACFVTLFASIFVLHRAKTLAPQEDLAFITLCFAAVVFSWMLTHTTFTMRYARLYYLGKGQPGGINFPGTALPTDWDFAYFAFTVGMTYQVADTDITSSMIRRTVLLHALMSFAYNTAIIALALNIFFGLVS